MNDFETAIRVVKRLLQIRKTAGVSMLQTPEYNKETEALKTVLDLLKEERLGKKHELDQANN